MSFGDNSYTRLLKENLNIQVVYDWTASYIMFRTSFFHHSLM